MSRNSFCTPASPSKVSFFSSSLMSASSLFQSTTFLREVGYWVRGGSGRDQLAAGRLSDASRVGHDTDKSIFFSRSSTFVPKTSYLQASASTSLYRSILISYSCSPCGSLMTTRRCLGWNMTVKRSEFSFLAKMEISTHSRICSQSWRYLVGFGCSTGGPSGAAAAATSAAGAGGTASGGNGFAAAAAGAGPATVGLDLDAGAAA
mmetsp:Transcript_7628/g.22549  ORF Transcript_7628/g.22549 Transcript_7628/m.22549 type:complete len:205 (-) Transcript_7628:738-1352(-)